MNTLILDLIHLVDQHLSTTEDVLINLQTHPRIIDNPYRSVKRKDWKAMLYHLQRNEYQKNTLKYLYFGACRIGDVCLMNLLCKSKSWKDHGVYYLAKGCHYKLIDEITKGLNSNYAKIQCIQPLAAHKQYGLLDQVLSDLGSYADEYRSTVGILFGLVKANDLEMIKSKKYGIISYEDMVLNCAFYLIGKYDRKEIMDYFESQCPGITAGNQGILIKGKIKSRLVITEDDLNVMVDDNVIELIPIKELTINGYHELARSVILKHKNPELTKEYVQGLVLANLTQYYGDLNLDPTAVIIAAMDIDDIELFKKFYDPLTMNYSVTILNVMACKSPQILHYLFDTVSEIKQEDLKSWGLPVIEDPRIARMLASEIKRGRQVPVLNDIIDLTKDYGCDVSAKILKSVFDQN